MTGAGGFILPKLVREPLALLLSDFGIDTVDSVELLHRHLTLTPFPASFRDAGDPLSGRVEGYRVPSPPRADRGCGGRAVFVTLGTIFNTESGDVLRTAALGAAACPAFQRVVVATGEHVDPVSLGSLPDHVVVHRFVQQDTVLAGCDAAVSHARSGTVLGALKQALPTVSLPMGADQHLNAERFRTLGLGLSVAAESANVDQVRDALEAVLASPAIRWKLEAVRDEINALPGLNEAIQSVADLVPEVPLCEIPVPVPRAAARIAASPRCSLHRPNISGVVSPSSETASDALAAS